MSSLRHTVQVIREQQNSRIQLALYGFFLLIVSVLLFAFFYTPNQGGPIKVLRGLTGFVGNILILIALFMTVFNRHAEMLGNALLKEKRV